MSDKEIFDINNLPEALEVQHIQKLLDCGRRQAYEIATSGKFHFVRVGTRIKVSKRLFFEWYEGKDFTAWLASRKQG